MTQTKEAIEALESARAHILDAYRIWQADDVSAVPPPKSGAGAVIAKIDAALSSLPIAGEGKVKALEWSEDSFDGRLIYRAHTDAGPTYVVHDDGFSVPPFVLCIHQKVLGNYDTVDAAKTAAQEDFSKRILSALEETRHA